MASTSIKTKQVAEAHLHKAKDKLRVAKKLFDSHFYEDAVGRAYYAMYHAAKACLALEGSSPKTHEGVISEFGRVFIATGKVEPEFGEMLSAAKEEREDSDYEVYIKISKEKAKTTLKDAEKFLRKIEEIIRTH